MSNDDKPTEANQRPQFSPEQKIKILREHLLDKVPISEVCQKHQITPTQFYQWQKTFFENGAAAFAKSAASRATSQSEQRITRLEDNLKRKNEVIAEIMAEHILLKRTWGKPTVNWVAHDIRGQVVDFIRHWSERTELPTKRLLGWAELGPRKYARWRERYGQVNEHNGLVPRDHWLEDWEKLSITEFARKYPREGYRRLAFMMLDANVAAVGPSSVYRVLKGGGAAPEPVAQAHAQGRGLCATAPAARALAH